MASAFVPKRLYAGVVPTSPPVAPYPYTAPAGTAAQIRALDFTNTTGSAVAVTVWAIPAGGTATGATIYLNAVPIAANANAPDRRTLVLSAGDALAWQAAGAGVNVWLSGAEETL